MHLPQEMLSADKTAEKLIHNSIHTCDLFTTIFVGTYMYMPFALE